MDVQSWALGVSRSGFYAWRGRAPSRRAVTDAAIVKTLRTAFALSDSTNGVRRILDDVRGAALPSDPGPRTLHQIAPHILDRDFTATAPDQKWVADFTYIWTREGWLYFAAVLDLYSRRIVGWSMQSTMTAQLVTDALFIAVWRRGGVATESLHHHSDQGSPDPSEHLQWQRAGLGITCRLNRSGIVWENAVRASSFSTPWTERCHRRPYPSRHAARADILNYVEQLYNPTRWHSTLGNRSPKAFEQAGSVV